MEKVIIFGTGNFGHDAYVYLTHDSPYEIAAFTVDRQYIGQDTLFSHPVVPFEQVELSLPPEEYKMLVALGFRDLNQLRAARYEQAKSKGYQFVNYVSSKATVWPGADLGENCVISPNSCIYSSAKIGNCVILEPSCVVGHYSVVKDHCFLGTCVALSGGVTVESYCFIGTGATVRDGVMIAQQCVIGAGALILEDTVERGVYMGKQADRLPISSDRLPLVRPG